MTSKMPEILEKHENKSYSCAFFFKPFHDIITRELSNAQFKNYEPKNKVGKNEKKKLYSNNYAKKSSNEDLGWTKITNKNKMKCSICQLKSHTEKDCKFKDTGVLCSRCQQKGHHYYACKNVHKKTNSGKQVALLQNTSPVTSEISNETPQDMSIMQIKYRNDNESEPIAKIHCLNDYKPQNGLPEDRLRNETFYNKLKLDSNLVVDNHTDDSHSVEDECVKFSTRELNVIQHDQNQVQLYSDVQPVQSLVFVDCGADSHASCNQSDLFNLREALPNTYASGCSPGKLLITHYGSALIQLKDVNNLLHSLLLQNVAFIPELASAYFVFSPYAYTKNLSISPPYLRLAKSTFPLYNVPDTIRLFLITQPLLEKVQKPLLAQGAQVATLQTEDNKSTVLHCILGHPRWDKFKQLCKALRLAPPTKTLAIDQCSTCVYSKQVKAPRKRTKIGSPISVPSGLKYALDLMLLPPSSSGYKYLMVCMDIGSQFTVLHPLKGKNAIQMGRGLEHILIKLKQAPQSYHPNTMILVDNDLAYGSSSTIDKISFIHYHLPQKDTFEDVCHKHNMSLFFTNPYTSTQNSMVERRIRTTRSILRSICLDSGIGMQNWDLLAKYALPVLLNLWPVNSDSTPDSQKTPWERFFGTPFPASKLHRIGSRCYVLSNDLPRKTDLNTEPIQSASALFAGWDIVDPADGKAITVRYCYIDLTNSSIKSSRNIIFHDTDVPLHHKRVRSMEATASAIENMLKAASENYSLPSSPEPVLNPDLEYSITDTVQPNSVSDLASLPDDIVLGDLFNSDDCFNESNTTSSALMCISGGEHNNRYESHSNYISILQKRSLRRENKKAVQKQSRSLKPSNTKKSIFHKYFSMEDITTSTTLLDTLPKNAVISSSYVTPTTANRAITCPVYAKYWIDSMKKELQQMINTGTFEIVDKSQMDATSKRNILRTKWVFKIKTNEVPIRFKSRLVTLGFMQDMSTIGQTYAPTIRPATVHITLILQKYFKLEAVTLDIEGAFLKADLPHDLFIVTPSLLNIPDHHIIRLNKSMYGLKEAPFLFGELLAKSLYSFGLQRSIIDPCLWVNQSDNFSERIFICTHVDDLLVVGPSGTGQNLIDHLQKVQPQLKGKMGPLSRFLGRTYGYSSDINGYLVSLHDYILEKNPSFNPESKIAKTPAVTNIQLKPGPPNPSSVFPYRELTGSLIYLSLLRPDLKFTAQYLSRFNQCHDTSHHKAALRAWQYAYHTNDLSLPLKTPRKLTLSAESDADWAGDHYTRSSTLGFVIRFGSSIIESVSILDKCIALSSAESELRGISKCAVQIKYYRDLLQEINVPLDGPTTIHNDNMGAISLINGHNFGSKLARHMAIHLHNTQKLIEDHTIQVVYRPTDVLFADILTKSLDHSRHLRLVNSEMVPFNKPQCSK